MDVKPIKREWLMPAVILAVSLGLGAWCFLMPDRFFDHHEWPALVVIVAVVLFLYGAANLFWSAIPRTGAGKAFFYLGVATMLLSWIAIHSLAGVIVGAVALLLGFALMMLPAAR